MDSFTTKNKNQRKWVSALPVPAYEEDRARLEDQVRLADQARLENQAQLEDQARLEDRVRPTAGVRGRLASCPVGRFASCREG